MVIVVYILLSLAFVAGWGIVFYLITDNKSIYDEINRRILKNKSQHCNNCNYDYYVCSICGCHYQDQYSSDLCRDWDQILGKNRHEHKYPHNHEEND